MGRVAEHISDRGIHGVRRQRSQKKIVVCRWFALDNSRLSMHLSIIYISLMDFRVRSFSFCKLGKAHGRGIDIQSRSRRLRFDLHFDFGFFIF